MSNSSHARQAIVFDGSEKELARYGRTDFMYSRKWMQEAPVRRNLLIRCILVCAASATLIFFLLGKGNPGILVQISSTFLIMLTMLIPFAGLMVILFINDKKACQCPAASWTSLRVGFSQKGIAVEHVSSTRKDMDRFFKDMKPIIQGIPVSQSGIPYSGIQQIQFCRPRNLVVIRAAGTEVLRRRKDRAIIKIRSFFEDGENPFRLVYIPLVFQDNERFLQFLASRTTIPIERVEVLNFE